MRRRRLFALFLPAIAAERSKDCEVVASGLCDENEFMAKWNNFANESNAYVMGRKVGIRDAKLRDHMIHRWRDVQPCL